MRTIQFTLFLAAAAAFAQDTGRVVIRATGQYDRDGSVLYNVYIASKEDDVEGLTISAAIPPGTRFLESVHKPQDATYAGVQHDTVFWTVSRLDRETLLGPFVFRVALDGSIDSVPATIAAAVAYQRPISQLIESPAPEGRLRPLADTGSISVDNRGTLDSGGQNAPVAVGDTGIMVFIPEGAITQRTTLSVRRLHIPENKLPSTDPPTWWCGLYQFTTEPRVSFTKAVGVALPSRRGVTPGNPIGSFFSADLETWNPGTADGPMVAKSNERPIGFGMPPAQLTCVPLGFGATTCRMVPTGGFGGFGAFGYIEQDNLRSKTTSSTLGASAASVVTQPPSIIAILIGVR